MALDSNVGNELEATLRRTETICVSGGAAGADACWCALARTKGLRIQVFSFPGHALRGALPHETNVPPPTVLAGVDHKLKDVAKFLGRSLPRAGYTRDLLRRNVLVAEGVDAVYAITRLEGETVAGGTAWACAYHVLFAPTPRLYIFDMITERWMQWKTGWEITSPPPVQGRCALIGSRDLTKAGHWAMRDVIF